MVSRTLWSSRANTLDLLIAERRRWVAMTAVCCARAAYRPADRRAIRVLSRERLIRNFPLGALFVGEEHQWRPIAEFVDNREPAASARNAGLEFCTSEASSLLCPALTLRFLPIDVGLSGEGRFGPTGECPLSLSSSENLATSLSLSACFVRDESHLPRWRRRFLLADLAYGGPARYAFKDIFRR